MTADQRAPGSGRTVGLPGRDRVAVGVCVAAVASLLLVLVPFVAVPLALVSLATAAAHRRSPGADRRLLRGAVVTAAVSLLVTLVLALTLLPVSEEVVDAPAQPVVSLPG